MNRKEFLNNEAIKQMGQAPRWSITYPDNKMPLDMHELMVNRRIAGCKLSQEGSTVTLDAMKPYEPMNYAFYIESEIDGYMVLDVEPSCKTSLKQKFLQMPYVYAETSLSGKGIHLLFPLPKCYNDFPIAKKKMKMQSKDRDYEILMNHWITFTGNTLPPRRTKPTESFDNLYAEMAKMQQKQHVQMQQFQIQMQDLSNIPKADEIIELLTNEKNKFKKTINDYNGDHTKYEFAAIGFTYQKMCNLFYTDDFKHHTYTANERLALLFEIATHIIPYRPKHDQYRMVMGVRMKWLMFRAYDIIRLNTPKTDIEK